MLYMQILKENITFVSTILPWIVDILQDVLVEECVSECYGLWYYCAHQTLERNGINKSSYRKAVKDLLKKGRSKYRNILIVGSADCRKTFM